MASKKLQLTISMSKLPLCSGPSSEDGVDIVLRAQFAKSSQEDVLSLSNDS